MNVKAMSQVMVKHVRLCQNLIFELNVGIGFTNLLFRHRSFQSPLVVGVTNINVTMQNSFWIGSRISDFLFKDFSTYTLAGFISICFGLTALAIFYELLVVCHISFKERSNIWGQWRSRMVHTLPHKRLYYRLFQTLLFAAQLLVSYILMLSIMTYNTYFTASIVIGGGIGYFLLANSVLELMDFGDSGNCADGGSNNSPPARRGSRVAEVLKTVAEDISVSVRAGCSSNSDGRSTTPEIVTA